MPTLLSLFLLLSHVCMSHANQHHHLNTYIVQLHPHHPSSTTPNWHLSFLQSLHQNPASRLLYSYNSAIDGFSARLTQEEAEVVRRMDGVIAVRPDTRVELHTTYSYKFLGLDFESGGAWVRSGFGGGTIVGVLDTGIWPESPSFRDHRMPPVPKRWKGVCREGQGFNSSWCNRKLIGARYYSKGHHHSTPSFSSSATATEYYSSRDAHGHGTHTSSTIAGSTVPTANVLGQAPGHARGTAPNAHLAVYKVCWLNACYSSDILAAIDDAINDGVDVLSLSLGGFPLPLSDDTIAIGAFRATERGILVVCAAGNNGPIARSVANEAPWIVTVGAGTMDRRFPALVRVGSGRRVLYGESMFPGKGRGAELEVVDGGLCLSGTLERRKVEGKMVVCERGIVGRAEKGEVVKEAGGAAMVLANAEINLEEDSVDVHVLPSTAIGYREALRLRHYMNNTTTPTAQIEFFGTRLGRSRGPTVALFSSRGPSLTIPSVLKPDLIAPGVNIIAAWPQNMGPSSLPLDNRRSDFSVLSGTSMACPHVSGIAALIRSTHPNWSPAMIKSALMTTADSTDHYGKPIMDGSRPATAHAMGTGHVNPTRAIDPGLVYDITPTDYVTHLCILNYTQSEIFSITHDNKTNCHVARDKDFYLNYPSLSVDFISKSQKVVLRRTLTNVGLVNSTYHVRVVEPAGVKVRVVPKRLVFGGLGERRGFRVLVKERKVVGERLRYGEGELTWVHEGMEKYRVRSPIVVTWV